MDFAENYSFFVQDAIQGFHWNNSQATLHSFVVYFDNEGKTESCIISDHMPHNANFIHAFTYHMIETSNYCYLKLNIVIISDAALSQYNLTNLMYHELEHQWHD